MRAALVCALLAGCVPSLPRKSFDQITYPVPTRTVEIDGIRVAYADLGAGERTLVLIHGLGGNLTEWRANFASLAQRYRVVALDLPGYGRSSKKNYLYSMEFFARVVDRLIAALDLRRVTLVGHSMGGQIALTHALAFPGRAESLVLVAPAGFETFTPGERSLLLELVSKEAIMATPPEQMWNNLAGMVAGALPREAEFLFRDRLQILGGPDFDGYCYAFARSVAAMALGPVFDRLPQIRVPVLVVFGTEDRAIPNPFVHGGSTRTIAEAGARRLPRARLVMIPRVGHLLNMEAPEALHRAVEEFLDHP